MAAGWGEGGVVDAAEGAGGEARAVHDDVGGLVGVVRFDGLGNVCEIGAAEDDAAG